MSERILSERSSPSESGTPLNTYELALQRLDELDPGSPEYNLKILNIVAQSGLLITEMPSFIEFISGSEGEG